MAYRLPLTALALAFFLGVIVVDVTMDSHGDDVATRDIPQLYYRGHRTARFPHNITVVLVIVLGSIPLIVNLVKKRSLLLDSVSAVLLSIALYGFVVVLVPAQEEIKDFSPSDPRLESLLVLVKQWHFVLVGLLVASMGLQIASHALPASDGKSKPHAH